jgi:GAF domain-containing protein/HAMP domain-containing protein
VATKKWRIAHKLTIASGMMIILTMLAGGVGLWQVLAIGQAVSDAREKEQQLAWSLELLTAGHRLVAALDHMLLTQDPLLASTDVAASLGALGFYAETLQEAGGEAGASDNIGELQVTYGELRRAVNKVDVFARQELWTEAGVALDQEVRLANERMSLLARRLVSQADRDVEAAASHAQMVTRRSAMMLAGLMVLTTAVALGWRRFVFRGLILSLNELRRGVARISSGDLEYKLDVRTGDEIEELSDEFNKMAGALAGLIGNLEQRIAERTRGLQVAAEVSRATTCVLDPDELLRQTVDLVRGRFDLYYVGLFLLDEEGRFAVLRAGTGEAGRQMLAQGHRLEVGGESMIGQCVDRDEARIALDVGDEPVRFDNPLLPETRSEMALPLRSRGRVIGAMTAQSVKEAAFSEAEIAAMQTMADQVGVAIDNARLFTETQAALKEVEATHRRYLQQAWAEYLQTAGETSYETVRPGVASLGDAVLPEIRRATLGDGVGVWVCEGVEAGEEGADLSGRSGGDFAELSRGVEMGHSALVAPIVLRGEVIGALGIHDDDGARQWTEDEIALVEAVAERMALAAENLRLLDETQRRAARERLTHEITDKMRRAIGVEGIVQTAVDELSKVLGTAHTFVRLGAAPSLQDDGSDES